MPLSSSQKEGIRDAFHRFVGRRTVAAASLDVAELRPNPFLLDLLIRGLGFSRAEEVAAFIVNQRFERGAVTSMGGTLQEIARIVAGPESGSGTGGADLEIHRADARYFIQVKSGPLTINKNIATQIGQELNGARQRYGAHSVAVLGICCGTLAELNPIARGVLAERGITVLAGAPFWDFLGDSVGVMEEIQTLARETAQVASGALTDAIRMQVANLTPIVRAQQNLP